MSAVLLISPEKELYRSVLEASNSCSACDCLWINHWTTELEDLLETEPTLVVAHVASTEHALDFVAPLSDFCSTKSPPIAVIAIMEDFDGPVYKSLLEHGVRDCLSRPLDVRRLAFFINSEVIRQQVVQAKQRSSQVHVDAYEQVQNKARRVALTNSTVLLTGETGVGKTHLAKCIHDHSPRAQFPFVNLNCASLAENLAESELFGHKKGAFTGADENYEGHFAASGKGTLFLDEIDSLSLAVQAKLLRTLDDSTYEPVGSVKQCKLESRLIAASNRSLEEAVEKGTFRKDLYYRLKVVDLRVPPLRERKGAFVEIARMLLQDICRQSEIPTPRVANDVWPLLRNYDWPGNLRELRNVLEHASLFMADGVLTVADLPASIQQIETSSNGAANKSRAAAGGRSASRKDDSEIGRVLDVLKRCNQNKAQAARELGISRNGLYKKLKYLGIEF